MKWLLGALIVLGTTSAVFADECMALWKERNGYYHEAGYCFDQALGQGYFGNEACRENWGPLKSEAEARIKAIRAREATLGCDSRKGNWTVAMLKADDPVSEVASKPALVAPAPLPQRTSKPLQEPKPSLPQAQVSPSISMLKKECIQNKAEACTEVGFAYFSGDGVDQNFEKSMDYYQKGCDGNDAQGCALLSAFFGMLPNKNEKTEQLIKFYAEKACRLGDESSCKIGVIMMSNEEKKQLLAGKCIDEHDGHSCTIYVAKLVTEEGLPLESSEVQKFSRLACRYGEADFCKYLID